MSICAPIHVFTIHSPKGQRFKRVFSTTFLNQVQVNSFPYALPLSSLNLSELSKFSRERFKPITVSNTQSVETPKTSFRSKNPKDINVLVVGSTGYIGKFVVKELVNRGFHVIAIARERSGIRGTNAKEDTLEQLNGANVCFSDVTHLDSLEKSLGNLGVSIDVVVSCLASRSGGVKDSWRIDYEATKNSLVAGRNHGASHFVLLSAICVQKPLLEFQRAKLKFEAELMKEAEENDIELVKDGKPYVMFGDGKLCACKPISEPDLASFIADCVLSEDKMNRVFALPIEIMDFAIGVLDYLVKIFPSLEDAAEFGKIGRYYAAESMLVLDPETGEYCAEKTPSYGKDTLEEFFERVLREGMAGQELGEQTIF
ncbi:NAD(P)-binding Rossmann-fold superfamily protein [Actinidia rufa]|uniref:Divinyl chlorophyllide a 8-vinyl-reductase, chloroplastic n=1 Tax=Actinidia rufa TaxID=165716 RepID=A0A7J0EHW3_9ERIC|nr:NAD(P)-binding Rossmann-fold superfamily protein [Actinidia rufa]